MAFDIERLKNDRELLEIAQHDTTLKRIASSGGGEYAGPCPFCGGRDRFRVQPRERRWLCRYCTDGKWADVIAYVMRRDNSDFVTACETLGGNRVVEHQTAIRNGLQRAFEKGKQKAISSVSATVADIPAPYLCWTSAEEDAAWERVAKELGFDSLAAFDSFCGNEVASNS